VEIESESDSEDENQKDRCKISIQTGDNGALRIQVRWFHKTNDSKETLNFKVRFDELVEYMESDVPSSGFDADFDTIVQHYILGSDSNGWAAPVTTEGANGETIFTFQTADGVFRVDVIITASLTELENGVSLAPNEMKLDVYINNFPYIGTGSYLALVGKVQSKYEASDDEDTTAGEEGTSLEGAAFFSWDTTVLADGVEVDVITSTYVNADADNDYDDGEDGGDGEDGEDGDGSENESEGSESSEPDVSGARKRDDGGDGDGDDHEDRPEVATEYIWTFDTDAQPASIYWDPKITTKGVQVASPASIVSVTFVAMAAALLVAS